MTTFNTSLQNAEFYVVDERTVLALRACTFYSWMVLFDCVAGESRFNEMSSSFFSLQLFPVISVNQTFQHSINLGR